jgi:hypothetical protein
MHFIRSGLAFSHSSFALLGLGLVLALPMHAQSPHPVDAHIQALGGAEALAEVKTLMRSGTAKSSGVMGDAEGTFEELFDLENERGFTNLDLGVFLQDSGWDQDAGWQQNSFEGLKVMQEGDLEFAKISAWPSALAHLRGRYGLEAFLEPEERELEGRTMVVLRVQDSPLEFLVDKETQLLRRMQIPEVLEVTYDDYRDVDGVKLPFATLVDVQVAGLAIAYEYEATVINGPVDASKFVQPN